jgi:hypothetical protein
MQEFSMAVMNRDDVVYDPEYQRRLKTWKSLWLADHMLGDTSVNRALDEKRNEIVGELEDLLRKHNDGGLVEVDRRENLSLDAFVEEYLKPGRPVVLSGVAREWPAVKKWSPRFFADNYGDSPVQLINAAREDVDDKNYKPKGSVTTVGQVVSDIESGGGAYPRFVPLLHQHPELMEDFDKDYLSSFRGPMARDMMFQFFMGGAGTNTALHCAIANNLFVEIYGRKRWWIFDPDYAPVFRPPMLRSTYFISPVDASQPEKSEIMKHVRGFQTILEPGDVLYNPPFWWHQVENLTATIGVGVRWFGLPSILKASTTQALLTLMATNPPIWVARKNRTDFVKNFVHSKPDKAVKKRWHGLS